MIMGLPNDINYPLCTSLTLTILYYLKFFISSFTISKTTYIPQPNLYPPSMQPSNKLQKTRQSQSHL